MIELIIGIVFLGLILYLIEAYIPMSPPFVTLLRVVVVVCIILWLIKAFNINLPSPF